MSTFRILWTPFPFVRYCIALMLGITLYLWIEAYQAWWWGILLLVGGVFLLLIPFRKRLDVQQITGLLGIGFLIGAGYLLTGLQTDKNKPSHFMYAESFSHYEVIINSLVEQKEKSWKATGEVKRVFKDTKWQAATGNVLLYISKDIDLKPTYGDVLLVKGIPKPVDGPKNPEEFDYRRYLTTQNIYHQHYLPDSNFAKVGHIVPNRLFSIAFAVNNYADSLMTTYIGSKQEYAVANAMVLGLRDDLDNDLVQAYSAAGAIHVLSVSGLHVGVIYVVLAGVLGKLKRIKKVGKPLFVVTILGILWFYAFVTGLSSPVLRSTCMFSLIVIAENVNRKQNSYNTVALSAFLLLLINPYFLINVGFQLSYLAVFGMIYFQPLLNPLVAIDKNKNIAMWLLDRIWKVTTVAVAAQIATLPITLYYFHQFPNYFLLANPIVILLSSVALIAGLIFVVIAALLVTIGWTLPLGYLAYLLTWSVKLLNWSVLWTERIPYSITKWLYITPWEMVLLYVLIFFFCALRETRQFVYVKLCAAVIAILLVFNVYEKIMAHQQSLLVIHAIPKHTAISAIEGTSALLYADDGLLRSRKDISFRFNNFWSSKGITDTLKKALSVRSNPLCKILFWHQKSLLLVDQSLKNTELLLAAPTVDFLILANNSVKKLDKIKHLAFKQLVIDGSYSTFYTERLLAEANQAQIPCYAVAKQGALVLQENKP
ncbi:MAG: ComEC/Rec2 family competence protein [Spirosomataceae bacterium]